MEDLWKYFLIAVLFWIIVDFTTAFGLDFQRWIAHMPTIWLFYLGYPAIFAFLIYRKKMGGKNLFLAMLVASFFVEIIFSSNTLLYTFPLMVIMIPAAISIYSFITYVPKWMVEGNLRKNKINAALLFLVWAAISILAIFGNN